LLASSQQSIIVAAYKYIWTSVCCNYKQVPRPIDRSPYITKAASLAGQSHDTLHAYISAPGTNLCLPPLASATPLPPLQLLQRLTHHAVPSPHTPPSDRCVPLAHIIVESQILPCASLAPIIIKRSQLPRSG